MTTELRPERKLKFKYPMILSKTLNISSKGSMIMITINYQKKIIITDITPYADIQNRALQKFKQT